MDENDFRPGVGHMRAMHKAAVDHSHFSWRKFVGWRGIRGALTIETRRGVVNSLVETDGVRESLVGS